MSVFFFPVLRSKELGEEHLKFESETANYKIAEILCKLISQGSVSSSESY